MSLFMLYAFNNNYNNNNIIIIPICVSKIYCLPKANV